MANAHGPARSPCAPGRRGGWCSGSLPTSNHAHRVPAWHSDYPSAPQPI
jgi:hypothetical protein